MSARVVGRLSPSWRRSFASVAKPSTSVDACEVARFDSLSEEWSDEGGSFKPLHSLNLLRIPWIRQNLPRNKPLSELRVADIGSGGGLLSVPLARLGLRVTGIDASEGAVAAAKKSLESPALRAQRLHERIDYEHAKVEDFAQKNTELFDAVVASEIVEHVGNLQTFVAAATSLARPGAPLFFTTMNKTFASRLMAVWLAEEVFGIVPRGVHDWSKFVPPEELTKRLEEGGCAVRSLNGIAYNPICNEWTWIGSTAVNYGLVALKL